MFSAQIPASKILVRVNIAIDIQYKFKKKKNFRYASSPCRLYALPMFRTSRHLFWSGRDRILGTAGLLAGKNDERHLWLSDVHMLLLLFLSKSQG